MNAEAISAVIEVTLPFAEVLKQGEMVESKHLFDPDYWESQDEYTQRWLGRLVAKLVREGALPLRSCDRFTGNRHNLYERI